MLLPTPFRKMTTPFVPGSRPNRGRQLYRPLLEVLEGRLAPTVTLSISNPAPFPKPDTGEVNGMFVVTRSGELGPGVLVDYATQDGSGSNGAHSGIDYTATSGTLSFAPNQTMATIIVPILGNNFFQADKTFTVSLSNPSSTSFTTPQTFTIGGAPTAVAVADFNGDGKPDIVVADGSMVAVLLNTTPVGATTPTFAPQQNFFVGSIGDGSSLAVGDLNGDGKPDIAVANAGSNMVAVLVNTTPTGATTPSFANRQLFTTDAGSRSVAMADFNGDGKLDLAVANDIADTVSVLLNTTPMGSTTLSFAPGRSFPTGSHPWAVAVGDFNGDGKPDLAVVIRLGGYISVLLNTTPVGSSTPSFAPPVSFDAGFHPWAVTVADFNGDGKPDLAIANQGGGVQVLLNTTPIGATTPSFADRLSLTTDGDSQAIGVADFNGDGKPDLAVANNGGSSVSVFLNTTPVGATTPTFAPQLTFSNGVRHAAVAVADFNGDGKPDIVVTNPDSVSVLLNNPPRVMLDSSQATGTISSANQAPATITVVAGNNQAATVNSFFATNFVVDVRSARGTLVQNVNVTFSAPSSGPSGTFGGSTSITIVTNASGRATAPPFLANTTAGSYLVRAQASGGSDPFTNFNLTNNPATLTTLIVAGFPSPITAGTLGTFMVTARDPYGNGIPGTTVHFTSSDRQAVLPDDYTFTVADNGVHTFNATLKTAGTQSLTASAGSVQGSQSGIAVNPAAASNFLVSGFPSPVDAGTSANFTVAARDPYGNTATGYRGTVTFSSSDPLADRPGDYTFAAGDNGIHTFNATLRTAGPQSITATDTTNRSIEGTQAGIVVNPLAANTLVVAGFPSPSHVGVAGSFTVTARDRYGNTATGYPGTIRFTSTDPQVNLPADYTFSSGDRGVHSFSATFKTTGTWSLTATDTATGTITGTQAGIVVDSPFPSFFVVAGFPSPVVAGTSNPFTVTAMDPYGNVAAAYAGTVHFTSSDGQADIPADFTFTAGDMGIHVFSAALKTEGTWSITVADSADNTITGTQDGISVIHAAASLLTVTGFPSPTTAGTINTFGVAVWDPYHNLVYDYAGTVTFSSSDGLAVLPQDYTFMAGDHGTHVFAGILKTAGIQSITATDRAEESISGTQDGIVVNPAAASTLIVAGFQSPTTAGAISTFTVTALDPYGNVTPGYRGTVRFASSDRQAELPSFYTFVSGDSGTHIFGGILKTAGIQSITATDTANGSIAGTQDGIVVNPAPASHFQIDAPGTVSSGVPFDLTVTALDPYGNVDVNYQGTVTFTSSDTDSGVVVPADTTFNPDDGGVHTFSGGVTLITPGDQTLTVQDTADDRIAGTATVTVGGTAPGAGQPRPATAHANAPSRIVLPALEAADVDRLFASIPSGKFGPLWSTRHERRAETGPWVMDWLGKQDLFPV